MGQDKRQKEMAGHCTLDMCGSIACARIRSTFAKDLDRDFCYREYEFAEARQRSALNPQPECYTDCGFQDVCKRLEMVVRLRDLDMLSNEMDNRAYHRNERMGVCDAGTDDHERKELAVDAACERADDSHGRDDAWDSLGDARLELWAGAGDLIGRGTTLDFKVEIKINEEANAMFEKIMRTEQGIMIEKQLNESFEDFMIYGFNKISSDKLIEAYNKLRRD